jgi:alanyl-tRNA synthetase
MTSNEIRTKYLDFFTQRKHAVIPSAPLVPENDPTTLFTGSGMQPLLPYLLGEKHPKGRRLVNSQKSFRAEDIEEVGDNRHTTFFEMLGNWSLGDYFKEEQLPWFFEFLTDVVGLDPNCLYVTVFFGDEANNIPRDTESASIWKKLFEGKGIEAREADMGSEAAGSRRGMSEGERVFYYDVHKNWWSRAGVPQNMPPGEPGGPDSEVFYDFGTEHDVSFGERCHPNCDCGRFMEIGNSVFMQYVKQKDGTFEELPQKNVDFGGGLERITAASNSNPDVFAIDALQRVIEAIEKLTGKAYRENCLAFRVVADHMRGAAFMIGDGVLPSNTDQGYVLRRLLRRAIRHLRKLGGDMDSLSKLTPIVIGSYRNAYPFLAEKEAYIESAIVEEEKKFGKTLERGLKEFDRLSKDNISGRDAFILFSTYGFPLELTLELALERDILVDETEFKAEMEKHRQESRTGAEQKFKGGLADTGEKTVMLHTATHLMLAGLRKYLGEDVHQSGSNITTERSRFDFTYPEKVSREVLDKVEEYVNEAIQKGARVAIEQMPKEQARASGVEGSFWEKYPDTVNVYNVIAPDGTVYSQELCGGPHVAETGDIKGVFKITKEEAVSAGVRRVRAILE